MKDRLAELRSVELRSSKEYENDAYIYIEMEEKKGPFDDLFKIIEEFELNISKMESNMEEVKKKQTMMLSNHEMDPNIEKEIKVLMNNIRLRATWMKTNLRTLGPNSDSTKQLEPSTAMFRIKKTQQDRLSKRFGELLSNYNQSQNEYREKTKGIIQRQLEISGKITSDDELEELIEKPKLSIFTDGIIVDTKEGKLLVDDIEARYADIINLEKSLRELNEIFSDIALLIDQQGDMLDNIERNVVKTSDFVATGKTELDLARKLKSKIRTKIICLITIISVIFGIIIIYLITRFT